MAYKWLTENCRNAKIILKVDDDVIVNMFHFLIKFVPSHRTESRYIACRRIHNGRIFRNSGAKWFVQKNLFKGQKVYPDFCQGFVVVVSNDLVPELYKSASITPFFWIDDVYLYGLVPRKISGIQYHKFQYGRDVLWGAENAYNCYKKNKGNCDLLAVMFWSDIPIAMDNMWTLIVQYHNNNTKPKNTFIRNNTRV